MIHDTIHDSIHDRIHDRIHDTYHKYVPPITNFSFKQTFAMDFSDFFDVPSNPDPTKPRPDTPRPPAPKPPAPKPPPKPRRMNASPFPVQPSQRPLDADFNPTQVPETQPADPSWKPGDWPLPPPLEDILPPPWMCSQRGQIDALLGKGVLFENGVPFEDSILGEGILYENGFLIIS